MDYDWSNAKGTGDADGWAKHKPMDCEEMLVKQVQMAAAVSPSTGYFIYRNASESFPSSRPRLRNEPRTAQPNTRPTHTHTR